MIPALFGKVFKQRSTGVNGQAKATQNCNVFDYGYSRDKIVWSTSFQQSHNIIHEMQRFALLH